MDSRYAAIIANDEAEVRDPFRRLTIRAKLAWYALSRPLWSVYLRRELSMLLPRLTEDSVFRQVSVFLNGDGGMFKQHVYKMCNQLTPLCGARVLVPGIGYAKNLLQLAAWKPKEIVAFDLYDYPEVWSEMAEKVRSEFGVQVTFYKGDFDAVPATHAASFDLIISDAVLEHVPDMPKFAEGSRRFLKTGGTFYASFGPLWYGQAGDHVTWGENKLFDHLLLDKETYAARLKTSGPETIEGDSCDSGFMIREGLFSYLKAQQYIDELVGHNFELVDLQSKTPPGALRLLREHPELHAALDVRGVPAFDRFSGGLYIWARKKS